MAINEDKILEKRNALVKKARPMVDSTIIKLPHSERSKGKKTRQTVEALIDRFLALALIRNDTLIEQILVNNKVVWIHDGEKEGHLLAPAAIATQLKTKKNGFTMYMPTNPITYLINGETYHLLTRIDSTRAKPNLDRLTREASAILSAARVNDCLCTMVMAYYETYLASMAQLDEQGAIPNYLALRAYVKHELEGFKAAVQLLNDNHFNWHPRGNGHEQLVNLINELPLLQSKIGDTITWQQQQIQITPAYI